MLALAAAGASALVGVANPMHAVAVTFAVLMALGSGALGIAHAAAAHRARLGGLTRQFGLAVAIAVGQMLVAVAVIVELMFVSNHDALLISVIALFTGLIAIRAAHLLARGVMDDVDALRAGLSAVAEGDRAVEIETGARDELAELAQRANLMVERLAAEEAARDGAETARRALIAAVSQTCARRSPRCGCWPRRWETTSSTTPPAVAIWAR